jgi:hypothetical protein
MNKKNISVPLTWNRKIAIKKIANLLPCTTPGKEIPGTATKEGTKGKHGSFVIKSHSNVRI